MNIATSGKVSATREPEEGHKVVQAVPMAIGDMVSQRMDIEEREQVIEVDGHVTIIDVTNGKLVIWPVFSLQLMFRLGYEEVCKTRSHAKELGPPSIASSQSRTPSALRRQSLALSTRVPIPPENRTNLRLSHSQNRQAPQINQGLPLHPNYDSLRGPRWQPQRRCITRDVSRLRKLNRISR